MSIEDGTVVNLPLTNDGLDISGNGLDLTTISGAIFVDKFLVFDGINDYAVRNLETAHKTASLTYSVIFKLDAVNVSQTLVSGTPRGTSSTGAGAGFVVQGSTSKLLVYIGEQGLGTNTFLAGTTVLNTTQIYNGILTYDAGTLKVYLNGVEENTVSGLNAIDWADQATQDPNPAAFYVGATKSATTTGNQIADVNFTNGGVKKVRQWNRALSPAEVLQYYRESLLPDNSFKTTQLVTRF